MNNLPDKGFAYDKDILVCCDITVIYYIYKKSLLLAKPV